VDRAAAHVHETPDADSLGRRIERRQRAEDDVVRAEHRVDDVLAASDRVAERVNVTGIGDATIRVVLKDTGIAHHRSRVIARGAQPPQDMSADEAAGSDHCDLHDSAHS
jgi:hypothetical protein